jgi:hypothetical protein
VLRSQGVHKVSSQTFLVSNKSLCKIWPFTAAGTKNNYRNAHKTLVYTRKLLKKGARVLCSSTAVLIQFGRLLLKKNFVFTLHGACVMCNFRFRCSAFWYVEAVSTVQLTLMHPEDGIHHESGKLRQLQYHSPISHDS